ncbi:DUF6748 domain-containing protein [Cellvibrio sp. UBA7661]|uniref:DUF6748 domain-containing protein n=1 Tax=Cellvibrio sp. UBA7661 TaxID=1946311 RepID=UPI002F360699
MNSITRSLQSRIKIALSWLVFSLALIGLGAHAKSPINPNPTGTTYIVKPDYRKCAFPMCGGWHLTPVNQYSIQLETEDQAYENSALLPNSIYVAYINYKRLGLTKKQIAELGNAIRTEQVLVRGTLTKSPTSGKIITSTKTLVANGAWISANKNVPVGTYLNITSTGIFCITTPCPSFNAALINSDYNTHFHDFSLEKATLTEEQEAAAWEAISTTGLIVTGTTYETTGFNETGAEPAKGTGVAATQVFFAYPAKKAGAKK